MSALLGFWIGGKVQFDTEKHGMLSGKIVGFTAFETDYNVPYPQDICFAIVRLDDGFDLPVLWTVHVTSLLVNDP